MGIFNKKKQPLPPQTPAGLSIQTGNRLAYPYSSLTGYSSRPCNIGLYRALRESVPIIDSAVNKIVRLMGGFRYVTGNEDTDRQLERFFSTLKVGCGQIGIHAFVDSFMEQLLTYGTAVGEMLYDDHGFYGLYTAPLSSVALRMAADSLTPEIYNVSGSTPQRVAHPEKILLTVLNPEPGQPYGTSLLRGLPFVSDILLKIYSSIGTNWERVGNVRYAVTYKPQGDSNDRAFAKEHAKQMAEAWRDAMSTKENVKDFVAVGDVKVNVIGADNQVLDSEVPVRQLLEQIIAKTGLMPYMFGLNWSTSERMAKQQTDILTTELEAYRRILTPTLQRIATVYLSLHGIDEPVTVEWEDITLQDGTEMAQARLYNAEADKILKEVEA